MKKIIIAGAIILIMAAGMFFAYKAIAGMNKSVYENAAFVFAAMPHDIGYA